jgi:hypothetical protein
LQLELKNVIEHIRGLEKKYQFDYNPEYLDETERLNLAPIVVPNEINDQYEIPNGLIGVNRDLFNKLGTHRWADDRDLQQMYRISQRSVPWKDHFAFKMKRAKKNKTRT